MDPWEELADEVSRKAAEVDCSPKEYQDGLRSVIEHLEMDLSASRETSSDDEE